MPPGNEIESVGQWQKISGLLTLKGKYADIRRSLRLTGLLKYSLYYFGWFPVMCTNFNSDFGVRLGVVNPREMHSYSIFPKT